jgi:hypothetical protein
MARARKKAPDAQPAAETAAMSAPADISADAPPAPAGDTPGSEVHVSDTTQAAGQQAEINQYPDVIKRADFGAYSVRLIQDRKDNEMQIRFGEGTRRDKPSDAVLDYVRSHLVPEQLKTQKEREEGKPVRWFNFSTEKGRWCAWMRNQPYTTRTKAEQVFDGAVSIISQELKKPPEIRSEGVPF